MINIESFSSGPKTLSNSLTILVIQARPSTQTTVAIAPQTLKGLRLLHPGRGTYESLIALMTGWMIVPKIVHGCLGIVLLDM